MVVPFLVFQDSSVLISLMADPSRLPQVVDTSPVFPYTLSSICYLVFGSWSSVFDDGQYNPGETKI